MGIEQCRQTLRLQAHYNPIKCRASSHNPTRGKVSPAEPAVEKDPETFTQACRMLQASSIFPLVVPFDVNKRPVPKSEKPKMTIYSPVKLVLRKPPRKILIRHETTFDAGNATKVGSLQLSPPKVRRINVVLSPGKIIAVKKSSCSAKEDVNNFTRQSAQFRTSYNMKAQRCSKNGFKTYQ